MEKNKDWTEHIAGKLRTGSDKVPDRIWDAIQRDLHKAPRSSNKTIRRWIVYTSGVAALTALILTLMPLIDNKTEIYPEITLSYNTVTPVTDSVSVQKVKETVECHRLAKEDHTAADNLIADELPCNNEKINECTEINQPAVNIESDTIVVPEKVQDNQAGRNINEVNLPYDRKISPDHKINNSHNQWSLGLSGTALALASNNNSAKKMFNIPSQTLEPNEDGFISKPTDTYYKYEHFQPISIGLSATLSVGHGLQLGAGINYTLLHSRAIAAIDNSIKDQNLHMIGIPVSLTWSFINREKFSSYVGVEAMGEKCVSANFGDKKVGEKEFQFSVGGLVGIQYRILPDFAIYAEPKLNHFFTNTSLRTIRTDKNVIFNIQLGFRFTH